jgi:sec-independent protein translocase protein TatA
VELLAPTHLLLVLAIALLVFGPKKLPELSRGLGEAIRGFKTAIREEEQKPTPPPPPPTTNASAQAPTQPPPPQNPSDTTRN